MSRTLQALSGDFIPQRVVSVAAFTVPAVGANATLSVDNSLFFAANTQLSIAGAGTFNIVSVDYAADTIVVQNPSPALPQNAAPTTVIASGRAVVNGAIVGGTPGYARLQQVDTTLALGTATNNFTGVANPTTARAWAIHGAVNVSTKTGILQCVCTPGVGSVSVVVTALDPAAATVQAGDLSDVVIFLNDAP